MNGLGAEDFPAFFEAVHGRPPFPWQARLARKVVESGRWPTLLDLPTGAGKTAAIDIAVFHLACEAGRGPARRAPLRILFVIDRRIVVDAAAERAKKIAKALVDKERREQCPVLSGVANALCRLSGDPEHPLDVVRLRGGAPQERDWARSPAQPLVAVSTVDQVGSRLLFRGYGVSPRMAPIHAGLVGADALWLLDEVHLSRPLEETLEAIRSGHPDDDGAGLLAERPRLAPFAVVRLSATPGAEREEEPFQLGGDDRAHQVLKPRLAASKLATLKTFDGEAARAFAEAALELVNDGDARHGRIAVVVNRVDLARAVFERLCTDLGAPSDEVRKAEVLLLTGRIRPLDREGLFKRESFNALFADAERPCKREPERFIILVATQTVEAGADLDFDAMVTEIAPLDALRQRFGRLDRLGQRYETGANSSAVILSPKGKPAANAWTPIVRIYGEAAFETRKWLEEQGKEIDFGIDAFQPRLDELAADPQKLSTLLAPRAPAPVLLPAYADLWATTSPAPAATPEPALFLHGPQTSADVQIVWRADVDPADEAGANVSLNACPPSSLEALPVPIWTARRWLRQEAEGAAFADVPERAPDRHDEPEGRGKAFLRLDRSGDREARWKQATARDLRAGDIIVVPAVYGGCDAWGWNPNNQEHVSDLGLEAAYHQRLKGMLRLRNDVLTNTVAAESRRGERDPDASPADELWALLAAALPQSESDEADPAAILDIIADDGNRFRAHWRGIAGALQSEIRAIEIVRVARRGSSEAVDLIIAGRRRLPKGLLDRGDAEDAAPGEEAVTDREDSSASRARVTLASHLGDVSRRAADFAVRAGLGRDPTRLVTLAAKLHDLGKADPRFQADLRGDAALVRAHPQLAVMLAPGGAELLAKSGRGAGRRGELTAAPNGFRHEALSVALAKKHPDVIALSDEDRDLVLWLIGTHHGHGRPFFPPCDDRAPETEVKVFDGQELLAKACEAPIRLDQGWFELATRVRLRFGPWELARLEAILRLADHAASADENRDDTDAAGGPGADQADAA